MCVQFGEDLSSGCLVLLAIMPGVTGCVSIQATAYEAQFDPPQTYIDFMGDRLPESAAKKELITEGVKRGRGLGFDVEFVAAVDSLGCSEICFLYRQRYVDDVYIVLTADAAQTRYPEMVSFFSVRQRQSATKMVPSFTREG